MKSSRYARIFAEAIRRHEPKVSDVVVPRGDRDAEIELIEQAMNRRKRRSALRVGAVATAAAAGLALVASATWRARSIESARHVAPEFINAPAASIAPPSVVVAIASASGAIVASPESSERAVAGRTLTAGSRLIVDSDKGAKLALSTGTRLDVRPGSQLAVVEDSKTQVFSLNAGSLQADVAKLHQDERFLVRTLDAEVEVRGTSFLVNVVASDPDCGEGTSTRVNVSEGVVIVRAHGHEDAVRAGESWPRGCRTFAAKSPAQSVAEGRSHRIERTAPATAEMKAAPVPSTPVAPPSPSSTLAEENNLFAEGMLARRNGQLALALIKMDRLLETYPSGHLAENAAAERIRLLRVLDPARAPLAARQYLKQYPAGFARADAEATLAGPR